MRSTFYGKRATSEPTREKEEETDQMRRVDDDGGENTLGEEEAAGSLEQRLRICA